MLLWPRGHGVAQPSSSVDLFGLDSLPQHTTTSGKSDSAPNLAPPPPSNQYTAPSSPLPKHPGFTQPPSNQFPPQFGLAPTPAPPLPLKPSSSAPNKGSSAVSGAASTAKGLNLTADTFDIMSGLGSSTSSSNRGGLSSNQPIGGSSRQPMGAPIGQSIGGQQTLAMNPLGGRPIPPPAGLGGMYPRGSPQQQNMRKWFVKWQANVDFLVSFCPDCSGPSLFLACSCTVSIVSL